jgi:hypothetical protein
MAAWTRTCLHCQQSEIQRHTKTRLLHIPVPQRRIAHILIDLVGPLQFNNNCNYVFTIIDRTSKWMEAIPLATIIAADCARALVFHWITIFGVSATINSDHKLQFTSSLWAALCEMLSISHCQTTAYHPEANSAVERLHHYCVAGNRTWLYRLPQSKIIMYRCYFGVLLLCEKIKKFLAVRRV